MDEIAGLIVEQIAKKIRESRQSGMRPSPVARAMPNRTAAPLTAAVPPGPTVAPKAPATPRTERPSPAPDPFLGLASPAAPQRNPLLAAFTNGGGLLAGIVLSEALAPPVALRERHPGQP